MTVSEYKNKLSTYLGQVQKPADFDAFWKDKLSVSNGTFTAKEIGFLNKNAVYEELTVVGSDRKVQARSIRPATQGKHPTVLMFHDLHIGVRGWHHMTRFIAQGYAVIALAAEPDKRDWKCDAGQMDFVGRYTDALLLANTAMSLPFVDPARLVTWGEGFGGGLAMVAAAMLPCNADCVAINPMPADFRSLSLPETELGKLDYVDVANFAPMVRGEVLMGICLLDSVAPPEGQAAIYNRLKGQKHLCVYPKYGHERVNFFENELVKFLHD